MKFSQAIPVFLLFTLLISGCKENSSSPKLSANIEEAFPCEDGLADGQYPCNNVGLFAHVSTQELGGTRVNDIWGWTDPIDGKEYALVGLFDGISFVDISDPNNPVVIGKLNEASFAQKLIGKEFDEEFPACVFGIGNSPAAQNVTEGATWRDVKVFDNHAFVVSDGQIHGMQVFDLTRLRDYDGTFMTFQEDAFYDRLGNAHNIAINEATGFAYAVGVTSAEICGAPSGTGLHIIDVNDPQNPTFAGCYIDPETEVEGSLSVGIGYIHDTQCVNYDGVDEDHRGKEICFSSAEGAVVITDVTEKENTTTIGFSGVTGMQYSHQGWLTEDKRYFLMNDELDETRLGRNTRTYVWNVEDLDNPTFVGYYTHETPSIDHNLYIRDNFVYQTNYTAGLQILRIGDLSDAELNRVAFFDTQPTDQTKNYTGTWSNYPFFESRVVIVSDINDGLYILKPYL
jgi:choice-of-anchor B domain-containing protein